MQKQKNFFLSCINFKLTFSFLFDFVFANYLFDFFSFFLWFPCLMYFWFDVVIITSIRKSVRFLFDDPHPADDLLNERTKNKMLQEEMEATLHDIQNM